MIDLEPIPYEIQKRLFEKMRVLGREKNTTPNVSKSKGVYYGLTHAKMATRSTFLRMTSGQLNPIILQGGKLANNTASKWNPLNLPVCQYLLSSGNLLLSTHAAA